MSNFFTTGILRLTLQRILPMNNRFKILALFCSVLLMDEGALLAQNVPVKEWDRSFGGSKTDEMYVIIQTNDGGYLLGGDSDSPVSGQKSQGSQGYSDYWIVKTDALGNKQWDKRFGGNSKEELFTVLQTPDNGYLLGGWSMSNINGDQTQASRGGSDYWIIRIDENGNKLWDKRYGGPGDDELRSMTATADGGYIFAGESTSGIGGEKSQSNHGEFDVWVVKTDVNGNLQWDDSYGGLLDDRLNAIQQTADGGYIIGAWTISPVGFDVTQPGRGSSDMWLIKTDGNGVKQWDGRYGGNDNEYLYALDQTNDGGFILAGYTRSNVNGEVSVPGKGGFDFWIVKTDGNGIKLWDKRYGGQLDEKGKSIFQTSDGGFIMGGWSESLISGDKSQDTRGATDYWLVRMDAAGNKIWDIDFGATNEERLHDVPQTSDGGFIIGGHSYSGKNGDKSQANNGIDDYWIVKVSAEANNQTFYADDDGDGFGDAASDTLALTAPQGYVSNNTDCNDANAAIRPDAAEICNAGIDDNCNGFADDADPAVTGQTAYYTDNDLDNYGTGTALFACIPPAGTALQDNDCDDNIASVHPGAAEICNAGIDDNCNGFADDADPAVTGQTSYYTDNDLDSYGTGAALFACIQPAGTALQDNDCDDNNTSIHPGAVEICDAGIDDNCNGLADDADPAVTGQTSYYTDNDLDSYGTGTALFACIQPAGTALQDNDCDDNNTSIHPGAVEICDAGIDDNCNGLADDADPEIIGQGTYFTDNDQDTYGAGIGITACLQPAFTSVSSGDCNDNNAAVNPGVYDQCNGIDDNCNFVTDENPLPVPVVTPSGTVVACTGENVELTTTFDPSLSYQWYKANALQNGATGNTYSTTKAGNFLVKVSTVAGCTATSATTVINRIDKPLAVVTPLGNLDICGTGSVDLQANQGASLLYQWKKGSTLLAGATNSLYTATSKGSYRVVVTNEGGCVKTSTITKVTSSCKASSLNDPIENGKMSVYPNPASGHVMVDARFQQMAEEEATIELSDLMGRIVYMENRIVSEGVLQFDLVFDHNLLPGTYLVKVQLADQVLVKMLLVQ
ncbi:MAG: T9SS type A sorting domain-containing protein [Chitinophagales bacterium]|nr:T9SS type A sorting domain-containing protein [Chitinophagales bacterium]